MRQTKPIAISKQEIVEAYKRVKANKGSAGIDQQSIKDFDADKRNNLYKLWNRLSSGSYMPPPVLRVEIPKGDGGTRALDIPTITDRIAQMVTVSVIIERVTCIDPRGGIKMINKVKMANFSHPKRTIFRAELWSVSYPKGTENTTKKDLTWLDRCVRVIPFIISNLRQNNVKKIRFSTSHSSQQYRPE